jgi:hypothetical protein
MRPFSFSFLFSSIMFLLVFPPIKVIGEESVLTGEEILQKSQEAMKQPYSYKSKDKEHNLEWVFYVKPLPAGSDAKLQQLQSDIQGGTRKITIHYGCEWCYELYPEEMVALDVTYKRRVVKEALEKIVQKKPENITTKSPAEKRIEVTTVNYEGHPCYELNITNIRANGEAGRKERRIIDQKTFLSRYHDLGFGQPLIYMDITPEPDITDDFFILPDGYEVIVIKDDNAYHEYIRESMSRRAEKALAPQRVETQKIIESAIAEVAVRTAQARTDAEKARITAEHSRERAEESRKAAEEKKRQDEAARVPPTPVVFTTERIVTLVVCNTVMLVFLIYLLFRRFSRKEG